MALQWKSTAYTSRWHLFAKVFATSFDREITNDKHPINVYTDFSEPYIATIEHPNGIEYMQFLKNILESDKYRKCKSHIPISAETN